MVISKNAKKLMAFVLAFAFVLTGFAYVPKGVQAAGLAPTVKVLGATLRLDGENGTQSLRLGIEVSNASMAKDCGIIIQANNSTVTVATDVEDDSAKHTKKHTDMYSIDTAGDKVVYSAVITGIPVNSFDLSFSVQGYVKALDIVEEDQKESDSGEPVEKSVNGVVDALKQKDPTVKIDNETGALVREKEDGTTEKITEDDIIFKDNIESTPDIALDLSDSSSYKKENGNPNITYNNEDKTLNVAFSGFQGIIFMNPADNDAIGNYKYVTVEYMSDKNINAYIFDGQNEEAKEMSKLPAAGTMSTVTYEAENSMHGLKLFDFNSSASITFKSIVFSNEKPVPTDPPVQPTDTPADPSVTAPPVYKVNFTDDIRLESGTAATQTIQEDGSANVVFGQIQGVFYFLPDTPEMQKSDYKHVYVTYTGTGSGNVSLYLPTTSDIDLSDPMTSFNKKENDTDINKAEQSDKIAAAGSDTTKHYSSTDISIKGIQLFHLWGDGPTLNIKSVIFSKNELTQKEINDLSGIVPDTTYDTPVGFMDKNDAAAGTVEDITYDSTVIKDGETVQRKAKVVLPKGYSEDKKYPVVYMLHGIGGNETSLYNDGTQNVFWNAAAAGTAKDMIAVFPNICANETGKPPVDENGEELFFSLEHYAAYDNFVNDLEQCLMPYVNENYSTLTGRENTAICGFSMGGREALYIGLTKTEYFGYVGGFCPTYGLFAYPPNWTEVGEDGMFSSEADFKPADEYLDNTLILVVKGKNDTTVHEQPYVYHSALAANNVPHLYYETLGGDPENVGEGGHDGNVSKHGLYNLITRMFKSE